MLVITTEQDHRTIEQANLHPNGIADLSDDDTDNMKGYILILSDFRVITTLDN